MPRTISDIRREIAAAYIADPTIQHAYKLTAGKTFEEQFSKVSLESILFWAFASAVYTLESLFSKHRTEVAQLVSEAEPHTLRWYAQRAKAYLHGYSLPPYKDRYDLSAISPEEPPANGRTRPQRYILWTRWVIVPENRCAAQRVHRMYR